MKSLLQAVVAAAVLAAPVISFAQSNQPETRAQVRAELVQLEQAGYNPGHSADAHYPSDIQAAEARVAAQKGMTSSVGADANGSSASGTRVSNDGMKPLYFGQ